MSNRGFTLIETAVTASLTSIVFAGIGAYYLETRASAAQIEAQVRLQRGAAVVTEWVARDLRSSGTVVATSSTVTLDDGRVRYEVGAQGLVRAQGGQAHTIDARVRGLEVTESEGAYVVDVRLSRPITSKRDAVVKRSVRVRRRTR